MVLKPWGERKRTAFQIVPEVQAMVNDIPGIRMFMVTPSPLPTGGENFPVNLILSSTAEPEQILEYRAAVATRCARPTACSPFRRRLTPRWTSRKWNWSLTATRSPRSASTCRSVGSDLAALVGGNYVNRFDLAGRSYKVIPQIERGARLDAAATGEHLRPGPEQPVDSRQHVRASGETHHAARAEPVPAVEFRQVERRCHRAAGHGA